jgi:Tfp pilus assembly protein PilV
LTLLEVLVALAILLMSLVGLGYLLTGAGNLAQEANYRSRCIQHCESKMAEVIAGAVPFDSRDDAPVEGDEDFHWSLSASQGSTQGLWNVTVRVTRQRPNASPVECSLSQMVLDPSNAGSTQDVPGSNSSSSDDDSSGTGSSSSPSSSPTTPASGASTAPAAAAPAKPATPAPAPAAAPAKPATPAPAPAATPAPAKPSTPSPAPKTGGK